MMVIQNRLEKHLEVVVHTKANMIFVLESKDVIIFGHSKKQSVSLQSKHNYRL